jgi:hypothetical protein
MFKPAQRSLDGNLRRSTIAAPKPDMQSAFSVDLCKHLIEMPLPVAKSRIRLARWHRISPANSGPNLLRHSRTVS